MGSVARPRVVCLPTWDRAFRQDVDSVMASTPGIVEPADLEATLRSRYPAVKARESELSGLRTPTWYVYRDGHFPWSD
jgi:hypothetical protein